MRRGLVLVLGVLGVGAATVAFVVLNPHLGTRVFPGADPGPVDLKLGGSYRVHVADPKTKAVVAAATDSLGSLNDRQRQAATYVFDDNVQRSTLMDSLTEAQEKVAIRADRAIGLRPGPGNTGRQYGTVVDPEGIKAQ